MLSDKDHQAAADRIRPAETTRRDCALPPLTLFAMTIEDAMPSSPLGAIGVTFE
ncbi:hypothetical protein C8D95_101180 [Silicimonas algicola]|uniref:Uncharacterized protein n=1 Tax=Silicimonas algicola TaxID=1826607 RepID=A0A316GTJ2_9RHOB|nr:hypothetical protein C8D95_101180 [Silicimonas algicola]